MEKIFDKFVTRCLAASGLMAVTAQKNADLSYIQGLDGLRALAIVSVVFCHANVGLGNLFPNPGHPVAEAFTRIAGAGWAGVDLFFVLSGFLITRILYATKGQAHYFRNFYMRRTLRIFPLYYLYAAFVLVVLPAVGAPRGLDAWKYLSAGDGASVLFYFYNFWVAGIGHHLPLVNQLWSLAVEEHFYFIWPLIVSLSSRKVIIRLTLLGCAFSFICRCAVLQNGHYFAAYVLSPCRLDGLFLGSFLAIARSQMKSWQQVRAIAPYAATISLAALVAITFYQGHFYDFVSPGQYVGVRSSAPLLSIGLTLLAVFFACILVFVLDGKTKLTQLLETPALKTLGTYSYGIYIYHSLVLAVVERWIHVASVGSKLVLGVLTLAGSTLIAAVSFRYFERPILKLKSRFPEQARPSAVS